MLLKKNLLCVACATLMFAGSAHAVELGVDPARSYAAELVDGTTLTDAGDTASFEVGYNFSPGEVRYGRFECTDNLTMDNVVVSEGSPDLTLGAINGQGTSGVFFSMTASDPLGGPTEGVVISVDADNTLEDGGAVNCAFSIYDQPSQAQAGGSSGRIATTGWQPFISRDSGFVFESDPTRPQLATADVEDPAGAYFGFDGDPRFGNLQFMSVPGVLKADGTQITLPDIFSADMTVTVTGDFTAANFLWAFNYVDSNWYGPDDFEDDAATFFAFNFLGDFDADLELAWTGTDAIPASEYFATLFADTNPGYATDDIGPIFIGEIVRNGTQLQAPLAQVPGAGWLSRLVLTNTGALDRPYQISVMGEDGNVIGTANTTGVVPANSTVVINLDTVMTSFSDGMQRRGTLNVSVAAPNTQIQGLYQIVNTNAGSLSNHVMVRPATN